MTDQSTVIALQDRQALLYKAMCVAIQDCYVIDEVKSFRDKARALEEYSKQAKNTKAERHACEIRIRAERRAGELLADLERMSKSDAGQIGAEVTNNSAYSPEEHADIEPVIRKSEFGQAIEDAGISRKQAYTYQKLAQMPEAEFEAKLTDETLKPSTKSMTPAVVKPLPAVNKTFEIGEDGLPKPIYGSLGDQRWLMLVGAICYFGKENFFRDAKPWREAIMLPTQRALLRKALPPVILFLQNLQKEIEQ